MKPIQGKYDLKYDKRSLHKIIFFSIIGWRRVFRTIVGYLFRSIYFFGSANWVTVKGKLASIEEAPILVAAPHTSFFDALSVIISGPSSVVGKIEAGDIPFYGSKQNCKSDFQLKV